MSYFKTFLQRPKDQTVLLIDGDLYLYKSCAAAEEEIDWGDDIWSLSTDLKIAKEIFEKLIFDACDTLDTEHFVVCFSDRDNFRKTIDPTYKAGRKKTRKPVGYSEMLKWANQVFTCHTEPLLEADDVMGILGSSRIQPTIIVSDDKDMKTVPCSLYRPMDGTLDSINERQADRHFLTQTLTGDPTDGYSGCPKVGPVTAEKLLGSNPSWSTVEAAYAKQKLNPQYALTQARLARILRFDDWDLETSTIKLWEPKR